MEYLSWNKLGEILHLLIIATMAASAKYAYTVLGGKQLKAVTFLGFIVISVFAAFLAGEFVPLGTYGRDGIIGLSAWGGAETIRYFEKKFFGIKEDKHA